MSAPSSGVYIATAQGRLLPAKVISLTSKAAYLTGLNCSPNCLPDKKSISSQYRIRRHRQQNLPRYKQYPLSIYKRGQVLVQCGIDPPSAELPADGLVVLPDQRNWSLSDSAEHVVDDTKAAPVSPTDSLTGSRTYDVKLYSHESAAFHCNGGGPVLTSQSNSIPRNTNSDSMQHMIYAALRDGRRRVSSDGPPSPCSERTALNRAEHHRTLCLNHSIADSCRSSCSDHGDEHIRYTAPAQVNYGRSYSMQSDTSWPYAHDSLRSVDSSLVSLHVAKTITRDQGCQTGPHIKRLAPPPPTATLHKVERVMNSKSQPRETIVETICCTKIDNLDEQIPCTNLDEELKR